MHPWQNQRVWHRPHRRCLFMLFLGPLRPTHFAKTPCSLPARPTTHRRTHTGHGGTHRTKAPGALAPSLCAPEVADCFVSTAESTIRGRALVTEAGARRHVIHAARRAESAGRPSADATDAPDQLPFLAAARTQLLPMSPLWPLDASSGGAGATDAPHQLFLLATSRTYLLPCGADATNAPD